MSENALISWIRNTPRLSAMFNKLSNDLKRTVLELADGEPSNLASCFELVTETGRYQI